MSTLTHHVDIIEKWPTGPAVESNEAGLGLPPTTKRLIQSARSCMPSMTAREVRNLCTLAEQTCWTVRNNTCFCFEHLFRAIIFIYQSLSIIINHSYILLFRFMNLKTRPVISQSLTCGLKQPLVFFKRDSGSFRMGRHRQVLRWMLRSHQTITTESWRRLVSQTCWKIGVETCRNRENKTKICFG